MHFLRRFLGLFLGSLGSLCWYCKRSLFRISLIFGKSKQTTKLVFTFQFKEESFLWYPYLNRILIDLHKSVKKAEKIVIRSSVDHCQSYLLIFYSSASFRYLDEVSGNDDLSRTFSSSCLMIFVIWLVNFNKLNLSTTSSISHIADLEQHAHASPLHYYKVGRSLIKGCVTFLTSLR